MRTYDECGTWVRNSGVTDPKIEDYMQKLLLHGRKEITVDRYRCVLKMLCRILTDLGRTCDSPQRVHHDGVPRGRAAPRHHEDRRTYRPETHIYREKHH
jgi:hypothetical protein